MSRRAKIIVGMVVVLLAVVVAALGAGSRAHRG